MAFILFDISSRVITPILNHMINTYGVSAEAMAKALPGGIYAGDFDGICDYLRDNVRAGDVILTVGAGDVYKVGQKLLGKN